MEKGDPLSFGADAWRVIDQRDSLRAAAREDVVQIMDGKANVMNAWAAAVDEPGDR